MEITDQKSQLNDNIKNLLLISVNIFFRSNRIDFVRQQIAKRNRWGGFIQKRHSRPILGLSAIGKSN